MSYSLQPFFNGINQGRLTLASGVPVTTTDQTAKTTIYFTPYKGNGISLFNGSGWSTISFAEASVAVPSTLFKCFDVFGFLSSGALAIETLDWSQTTGSITAATNATPVVVTSNSHGLSVGNVVGISGMTGLTSLNGSTWVITAQDANTFTLGTSAGNGVYTGPSGTWYKINNSRATALVTTTGGVYTKSGDATRLYLGTGCTTGTSGQTEDSYVLGNASGGRRLLWNYYNRVSRDAAVNDTTASYNYTTTTFRQANAKGGNKVEIVVGVSEDPVNVTAVSLTGNSAAYSAGSGIGMDSVTTTGTIFSGAGGAAGGGIAPNRSDYIGYPSAGYHTIAWLETTQATGTTTWYGTQSLYFNNGLKATVIG